MKGLASKLLMKTITAWLTLTVCVVTQASAGEVLKIRSMADRADDFKKTIQFQEKLVQREKHEQVCVDWEKLAAPKSMAGWKVTAQMKEELPSYTVYSWVFNRADDYVDVNVNVYPVEKNSAQSDFIDIANSTSMREIRYVVGPDNLGTVSAISKSKLNKSVFWIFRNTLIQVTNRANDFDVLPLAYWLQKQAETHVFPIKNEK